MGIRNMKEVIRKKGSGFCSYHFAYSIFHISKIGEVLSW